MRHIVHGVLVLSLIAGTALVVSAGRPEGTGKPGCTDDTAVAAARAAADLECCEGARNHGQYVSCVARVANELADDGLLPEECKGAVTSCAARSTCGRPGAVTCCRIDSRGRTKCSIKSSAEKCKAPKGGVACPDPTATSCCDACGAGSPDGAFVCPGPTTTTTAAPTTTTEAPTTTTAAPTTTTTTTMPGSPSPAFLEPYET